MPNKPWKAYERKILRRLGTERIPNTGERDGADGLTEVFAYQIKHRGKSAPPSQQLLLWLDGICDAADRAGGGRIGVVIWQRAPRCLDSESLVVLKLRDWEALHGSRQVEDQEAVHTRELTAPTSTNGQR